MIVVIIPEYIPAIRSFRQGECSSADGRVSAFYGGDKESRSYFCFEVVVEGRLYDIDDVGVVSNIGVVADFFSGEMVEIQM